ncbi:MAG: S9 family peptidase [bacterium]|nr:S9 family peptidase [bacterium]
MDAEKRPIAVDDLYKIITVEDPRISPDGAWIAFVRVTVDKMDNGYKRNLWICPTSGGEPRQLTRSGKDSSPRWSPDGKTLAFISARDGKPQIYFLPVTAPGGEPRALTSASNGATSFNWSPDGTHIAYLSSMNVEERSKEDHDEKDQPPKDKLEGKHRGERRDEDEKKRLDPYPMSRIPYRAGTSFLGDRCAQVYVVPTAEGLKPEEAKPRRLTNIDANHETPYWSPDGEYLFTARQIDPTKDEPFRQSAVFRIRVSDGQTEQLTGDDHAAYSPVPSPDGKWVAYNRLPQSRGMYEQIDRLTVMPMNGGKSRDLNLELDRSTYDRTWAKDGKWLYFAIGSRGRTPLYRVDPVTGATEEILSREFIVEQFDVAADGSIAYTASTPESPAELYYLPAGSQQPTALTHFNQEWLSEVVVQPQQELLYTLPDGTELQGWYMLPVGYQEGEKYPLALNIHGGPHVMWGPAFPSMWHEWQFHAAQGYVVLYVNPRGSDGYGEAFRKALHAAWGDVAYVDIMAGVDALLAKGFVDENRLALTGGSYGGYMVAWIIGHTDRFVSAVSQRGVYSLVSFYGTSDVPSLISGEFDVDPWEDHDLLWKHSPLAYAHQIKTPLLIEHAENDFRVPIEQAEQMFAFVRRSGGTVAMWRYPREGHEMSRSGEPEHRIARLTHMVNWFHKYCKPQTE